MNTWTGVISNIQSIGVDVIFDFPHTEICLAIRHGLNWLILIDTPINVCNQLIQQKYIRIEYNELDSFFSNKCADWTDGVYMLYVCWLVRFLWHWHACVSKLSAHMLSWPSDTHLPACIRLTFTCVNCQYFFVLVLYLSITLSLSRQRQSHGPRNRHSACTHIYIINTYSRVIMYWYV